MKIIEVLNNIDYIKCYNKLDLEFNDVGVNSNDEVDMFIGLKGENNDGSIYYEKALENGIKIVVINNIPLIKDIEQYLKENNKMLIIVEDTLKFLQQLATYKRSLYDIPVIGITGSAGKTSTKDLVYNVVSKKYKTLKTKDNYNNHIGVPLTILALKDHECLVVEMGMDHFGEISNSSKIAKPTLSLITNIGTCHMELLGGIKGVLKAKLEILDGMSEPKLIVNNDNQLLHDYANKNKVITFGIDNPSDIMIKILKEDPYYSIISYKNVAIKVPKGGHAFIYNATAAIAVGIALNVPIEDIKAGIENTIFTSGRNEIIKAHGYEIISDCYNANLEATTSAINYLGLFKNRKIAVLGTIGQLGDYAESGHGNLGHEIYKNNIDILVTVGKNTNFINEVAISDGFNKNNSYHFTNIDDAIKLLKSILKENDTILVKASHFNNFIKIVDELKK